MSRRRGLTYCFALALFAWGCGSEGEDKPTPVGGVYATVSVYGGSGITAEQRELKDLVDVASLKGKNFEMLVGGTFDADWYKILGLPKDQMGPAMFVAEGQAPKLTTKSSDGKNVIETPKDSQEYHLISYYYNLAEAHAFLKKLGYDGGKTGTIKSYFEPELTIRYACEGLDTPHVTKVKDNAMYNMANNSFMALAVDKLTGARPHLNLGVMVHELTHAAFFRAVDTVALKKDGTLEAGSKHITLNVIKSIDEGNADYLGAVATGDPAFVERTIPGAGRSLANLKTYSTEMDNDLQLNWDDNACLGLQGKNVNEEHVIGAVWGSSLWQIGEVVGHEKLAKAVVAMWADVAAFVHQNGKVDFPDLIGVLAAKLGDAQSVCTTMSQTFAAFDLSAICSG